MCILCTDHENALYARTDVKVVEKYKHTHVKILVLFCIVLFIT